MIVQLVADSLARMAPSTFLRSKLLIRATLSASQLRTVAVFDLICGLMHCCC
jgi:hypothetical protein